MRRSGRGGRPRGRRGGRPRCAPGAALRVQVECGLGAGEVAEGLGTSHVEGLGRAEGLLLGGLLGQGMVEVESVGDVEVGLEPHGAGEVDVLVVQRRVARVDRQVAVLRVRGRISGGEVVALDGLRDEAVELGGTDLAGDGRDLRVDEGSSLDGEAGEVWMVVSATVRARHAGTAPDCTCAHSRGSRWRSSRACPMSFFAEVVEIPSTAPSSAMQNSATNGHPSPASGSSWSEPGTVNTAAEWIDSGGWRSAHRAARSSWRAAPRSRGRARRGSTPAGRRR